MKNTKSKHFILRSNTCDEFYDGSIKAFVVTITPELKKNIVKLSKKVRDLKKTESYVYGLEIFESSPIPIGHDIIEEEVIEELDGAFIESKEINEDELKKIVNDNEKAKTNIRFDGMIMKLDGGYIMWNGYYKNTTILVESGNININDL